MVTNRRLYRVHGLVTTHRPSVALHTITVIDLELGPAGRWFGTLIFDTPAQRDGPLHRFTFVRDASQVHKTILRLRAEAAPRRTRRRSSRATVPGSVGRAHPSVVDLAGVRRRRRRSSSNSSSSP